MPSSPFPWARIFKWKGRNRELRWEINVEFANGDHDNLGAHSTSIRSTPSLRTWVTGRMKMSATSSSPRSSLRRRKKRNARKIRPASLSDTSVSAYLLSFYHWYAKPRNVSHATQTQHLLFRILWLFLHPDHCHRLYEKRDIGINYCWRTGYLVSMLIWSRNASRPCFRPSIHRLTGVIWDNTTQVHRGPGSGTPGCITNENTHTNFVFSVGRYLPRG